MKNAKVLMGLTTASIAAALSVALMACGDDSSSTAPEPITEGNSSAVEESSSSELPPDTTCCKVTSSSSSEELSSSSISSSSQEETVQQINDIFGMCLDKKVDPMMDAALPPVAYLGYEDGDDSATVVVENVSMNCRSISGTKSIIRQPIVGNIYLSASSDTLYMQQAALDTVNAEPDCICDSRLIFKVKADPAFINASLLVAVRDGDYGNRMEIIKAFPPDEQEPPKYELDKDPLKSSGLTRGTCMDKPVPSENNYDGLPVADFTVYENGLSILNLKNVEDNCAIEAKLSQKVVDRDTLVLEYYDIESEANCMCTFDSYEIEVKNENAGFRYAKFKGVVYYVNYITYTKIPDWEP